MTETKKEKAERIHLFFDDDGVLHKWNDIQVEIPEAYVEMSDVEKAAYIKREVYQVLTSQNYYARLPVYQKTVDLLTALHAAGFDIKILSCSINADTSRQKLLSIREHLPWLNQEDIVLLPDGMGSKKAAYIPRDCYGDINILCDDHTPNCVGFAQFGEDNPEFGQFAAIKYINDVNGNGGTWQGPRIRMTESLEDSLQIIQDVLAVQMAYQIDREMEPDR